MHARAAGGGAGGSGKHGGDAEQVLSNRCSRRFWRMRCGDAGARQARQQGRAGAPGLQLTYIFPPLLFPLPSNSTQQPTVPPPTCGARGCPPCAHCKSRGGEPTSGPGTPCLRCGGSSTRGTVQQAQQRRRLCRGCLNAHHRSARPGTAVHCVLRKPAAELRSVHRHATHQGHPPAFSVMWQVDLLPQQRLQACRQQSKRMAGSYAPTRVQHDVQVELLLQQQQAVVGEGAHVAQRDDLEHPVHVCRGAGTEGRHA